MFVDEVDIVAISGDGGSGCMSFRREKFVPRGGPDGGNGGWGGSVYLVAAPNLNTLVTFRYHPEFKATRGGNGEGSNRTGRSGKPRDSRAGGTVASTSTNTGTRQVADRSTTATGAVRAACAAGAATGWFVSRPLSATGRRSGRAGRDRRAPLHLSARRRRTDRPHAGK